MVRVVEDVEDILGVVAHQVGVTEEVLLLGVDIVVDLKEVDTVDHQVVVLVEATEVEVLKVALLEGLKEVDTEAIEMEMHLVLLAENNKKEA